MRIDDYYLDIDSVFELEKDKREIIVGYYDRLLDFVSMGDTSRINSLFNTLIKTGFLKNKAIEERTDKLDAIMS